MFDRVRPRIPVKGPILVYAGIALSLGAWAHLARQGVDTLVPADSSPDTGPPIDLDSDPSIEAQLARYMPLAGLEGTELLDLLDVPEGTGGSAPLQLGSDADVPDSSYLMTSEQLRARRAQAWSYPGFDTRGRHGAPLVATPRNVIVRLVDAHDEPLVALTLQVTQNGRDGSFSPSAHRSVDDPTVWIIGSPLLSPGGMADFELLARTETEVYYMVTQLRQIAEMGDVDLGSVRLDSVQLGRR